MKTQDFDRLLSQIRNVEPDDASLRKAGEQVWNSLSAAGANEVNVERLRSCADFQALLPAYLDKRLPQPRTLLMEDHLHQCVACRRAWQLARGESVVRVMPAVVAQRPRPALKWAAAFSLAMGVVIGLVAGFNGLLPGQHSVRATVQSVDGSLFYVSDEGIRAVPAGYRLRDGEELRTGKNSDAMVRLVDGSLVEISDRSEFSIVRGWKGTTIHLDAGHIIVQATKQRVAGLYVATDDCLVSSKGTIFAVNQGTKGSRVSVLEGAVTVAYGQHIKELTAGEQATTTPQLSDVPIQNEIAWSKDAGKYLAILGELSALQKQIEAIPGPGLRYQSSLLQYVPDDTTFYAALPNLGSTLEQATELFEARLQQSPVLRSWWHQQQHDGGPKLQDLITRLATFGGYLGDEVVIAAGSAAEHRNSAVVVLAEVRKPGLRAFIEDQLQQAGDHSGVQIVDNPSALAASSLHPLLIYVTDNMFVAASGVAELQKTLSLIQHPESGHFAQTPFHQQIVDSYQNGAGWLFCVNMEQIVASNVNADRTAKPLPSGLGDVRYLLLERRETGGKTENRASVTFARQREGIAAWLAAPAPMGSADFVSPEASLATSFVIKDPRSIMEEAFQSIASDDPSLSQHLADFEAKTGVSVLDDISGPLGGDVTFALDGPLLPTPSWKLVIEVYDPEKLQSSIARLIESLNQQATADQGELQLVDQPVGSQHYFTLGNPKHPDFALVYTFVDGYLIAGPNQALLARAIQNREAGYTLTRSQNFRAQLPNDGYTNFSAILYHNLGAALTPVVQELKASGKLTPQKQQSLDALAADSAPGLIYAYGEPDRIVVASSSGFLGLNLDSLLTIGEGRPLLLSEIFGEHSAAARQGEPVHR